jgi:serine phosphatase RsbU (regulator of sigma subunit)
VSYKAVVQGDSESLSQVSGRVALVGLTEDLSHDFVSVPRLQAVGQGIEAYGLPGVGVLAAITETLMRGAPIRDAPWHLVVVWNVLWSLLAVSLVWKGRPVLSVVLVLGALVAALAVTGVLHVLAGTVFPAGLLTFSVFLCGVHALVSSYVETSKELHREEAERQRVEHEMEMARATQERFLPESLPDVEGMDIWGVNISSLAVSGDYYDVLAPPVRNALILVIADVSGKGLPASLVMSNVQAGLHTQLYEDRFDLKSAAQNLNRLLCENTDSGTFVTLFLVELDKKTCRLRYIRAGHDEPIIISGGDDVSRLKEGGPPLGLLADFEYAVETADLKLGDVLCLYTDGVTEAMNPEGEQFGVARFIEVLKAGVQGTAREMGESVVQGVRDFTGLERQADDVTLLIAKIGSGPHATLRRDSCHDGGA